MIRKHLKQTMFSGALMLFAGTAQASSSQAWTFKVFLDEKEIGHHSFKVMTEDKNRYVAVEAKFDVNILFFTAYTYQHSNYEVWQGECLKSIQSKTDDNGEILFVQGGMQGNVFHVSTQRGENQIAGCIKTFSYWDPEFLKSKYLLNAQTGELLPVTIQGLGYNTIDIRGNAVSAKQYRIVTDQFTIDLWYSPQHEWLALQSTTREGAVLRYQMQ